MVRPKRIITTQTSDVQNDIKLKENGQKSLRGLKRGKRKQLVTEKTVKQRKVEEIKSHPRHNRGPGFVLVQGQGDVGQLGLGEDVMERKRPARVPLDKNIVDICAGGMHTVCLTDDGEIYTFGCNDEGALGRDTSQEGSEFIPGKVDIPGRVVQVSAGDSHTVALTEDGRAFIWGNFRDSKGAMGLIVKEQLQPKPLHILPLVKVQKIASGSDHLVLLSHDGYLYTSGCGEQGQLGRIAECFTLRGGRKGLDLLLTPAKVNIAKSKKSGMVLFDDVWAGFHATFARARVTGHIYACGLNNYHQLGVTDVDMRFVMQTVPSFLDKKWQRVACGLHHTLALDDSGQVHALGRREYGRLGLGESTEDKDSPSPILAVDKCLDISCGISTSYAVAENGLLHAWGMGVGNDDEDLWEPTIIRGKQLDECKVVAVGGGGQHVVFLAVSTTK